MAKDQSAHSAQSCPTETSACDPLPRTTPSRDWLVRAIIVIVIVIWASGAVAQILMPHRYSEPWWIHVIALCTVSYSLTGDFVHSRLLNLVRENVPTPRS